MRQEGIPVSARRPEHDLSLLGKNHPSASGCPHAVHRRRLRRSETPKAFGQDFPDPPLPLQSLPPVQGTTPTVDIRDRDLDQVPQLVDASLRRVEDLAFGHLPRHWLHSPGSNILEATLGFRRPGAADPFPRRPVLDALEEGHDQIEASVLGQRQRFAQEPFNIRLQA